MTLVGIYVIYSTRGRISSELNNKNVYLHVIMNAHPCIIIFLYQRQITRSCRRRSHNNNYYYRCVLVCGVYYNNCVGNVCILIQYQEVISYYNSQVRNGYLKNLLKNNYNFGYLVARESVIRYFFYV